MNLLKTLFNSFGSSKVKEIEPRSVYIDKKVQVLFGQADDFEVKKIEAEAAFLIPEEIIDPMKELYICFENRKKEYPSWESAVEAILDSYAGNFNSLQQIVTKRAEVKAKYPKPNLQ